MSCSASVMLISSSSLFPLLEEMCTPGSHFGSELEQENHRAPSGCSVVSVDPVGLAAATSGYWVSAGSCYPRQDNDDDDEIQES